MNDGRGTGGRSNRNLTRLPEAGQRARIIDRLSAWLPVGDRLLRGGPSVKLSLVPKLQGTARQRLPGVLLSGEADTGNHRVTLTPVEEVGNHIEHVRNRRPT